MKKNKKRDNFEENFQDNYLQESSNLIEKQILRKDLIECFAYFKALLILEKKRFNATKDKKIEQEGDNFIEKKERLLDEFLNNYPIALESFKTQFMVTIF